ncbi:MAG: enoyl-CoA hydratase-related protein [Polyangiaceae bacterium]|jgi:enoyl-CoA hydratase/carnithine racemase|nr:enoyl-CoA hydratase-related protein [Polyangiaceae bacterium]
MDRTPYSMVVTDGCAVFCIEREAQANAMSREVLLGIGGFAREMGERLAVRALVVTGAGDRFFCAGADLKERAGWTENDVREQLALYRRELGALDCCPKVVVAAINGLALGGGLELAMACDLRVASPSAVLGQPEVGIGIIPGAGGTQRLPRLVGEARAKEMILLGRRVTAQEALCWGLVNRVAAEATSVVEDARAWLAPVVGGAAVAQRAALQAIDAAQGSSLEHGLDVEQLAYDVVLRSEDRVEGLRAFAEKRAPVFRGK